MAGLLDTLSQYKKGLLDHLSEVGGTIAGNEMLQQRAGDYSNAVQRGLLSSFPMLAKQPQNVTMQDMLNSGIGVMPAAITAWHGSPHVFDKFDMSKLGTGEGAQAYGHGLYAAENPDVAQSYSKPVISNIDVTPDGKVFNLNNGESIGPIKGFPLHEDLLKEKQGNLYKLSLEWPDAAREAADPMGPQHFLDWDKALSEQNKHIQDQLAKYDADSYHPDGYDYDASEMGQDIYTRLRSSGMDGKLYKELGIPGIRYLDQGSRGAGDGSYNYVLFDDKIPRIVERNGQPMGLLSEPKLTEYEKAHQVAQQNAVKLLGLPPDNTAMDRARAMGFNVEEPLYHGTNADIREFSLNHSGSASGNEQYGAGIYTTTSPSTASGYANQNKDGANVMPLLVKMNSPITPELEKQLTKKQIGDIIKQSPNLDDALWNYGDLSYEGKPRVLKNAIDSSYDYQDERLLDSLHPIANDFFSGEAQAFNDAAAKVLKKDGVEVNFDSGEKYKIPWNPSQVRSRFAAFDPRRKNSADLLAGLLLPTTMLGLLSQRDNKQEYQ